MIIPVSNDYRIISTPSCWEVQESSAKRWRSLAYHTSFDAALSSLADHRIRLIPDSATAAEIVETLKVIKAEATEALNLFRIPMQDRGRSPQESVKH